MGRGRHRGAPRVQRRSLVVVFSDFTDPTSAQLMIESIGPAEEGSYYRRVTGRIEARLCPVDWPGQDCQDAILAFDTDMQLETTVVVQE